MHTTVDESGTIHVHPPRSQAADYIEFRADLECLVRMTVCPQVCPQDQNACNGYRITPLGLTIYGAG
jgi:uncharacterized protein YcgI (DUF1989 family)